MDTVELLKGRMDRKVHDVSFEASRINIAEIIDEARIAEEERIKMIKSLAEDLKRFLESLK